MASSQYGLILRNARLAGPGSESPRACDIVIADGAIAQIADRLHASADQEIDCAGRLVSPPLVESHIHLDSVFTDDGTTRGPASNRSGTLFEGIRLWADWKQSITHADVVDRATRAVKQLCTLGVTHIRTHADVSEPTLKLLDALLEVRQNVRSFATVQVVAFPQDGIFALPRGRELLEEAAKRGVDAIGAIPHAELCREDGVKSVHVACDLANQHDKLIDLHCDEVDDPQSRFLEVMNARAIADGNGPRVTASHTTAFGSYDNGYAVKLLGRLRQGGINFVANPLINIHLQGRADTYPKRRGITRVPELLDAGLNVSLGHDCIQDPWYALGTGNMLDVAHMAAHVCHLMTLPQVNACFDMVCWGGATTLNLRDRFEIQPGAPANLVVHAATSKFDAIRLRHPPSQVIHAGRLIATSTAASATFTGPRDAPSP